MKPQFQPVRGTKDILPEESVIYNHIIALAREIASLYNYGEISTPIFEFTDIFKRSLGDTSDVVTKEMYSFETKGEDHVTLRPEFTAAIVRAFISNGLTQNLPQKFFSHGPIFRYERPEKGRYRQFNQLNFEFLGVASVIADIEVISMADHLLKSLGIRANAQLELNSLADKESREIYRNKLVEYFSKYEGELSEDSKNRLHKNPLRILDSKDENDKKLVHDAPILSDYYNDDSKRFFAKLQENLHLLGVSYHHNPRLVRGLDYYCHTAFEFTTTFFGDSKAILAGGRYDGLVSLMGGPETPAIGFASGIERLMALMNYQPSATPPIAIIAIGEVVENKAIALLNELRRANIPAEYIHGGGNLGKKIGKANKLAAKYAVIIGEEELKSGSFLVKNMETGTEEDISNCIAYFAFLA